MYKSDREKSLDSSPEETDISKTGLYCVLTDEPVPIPKPNRSKSAGNNKDNKNAISKCYTIGKCDKSFQSIHQGFLTKQGGNIKNWKKRFFTLRSNQVLYYYRDVNKDPQGEIDLNDANFSIREGTLEDGCWPKIPLDRCMVLITKLRKYYLYSETIHETDKWIETIREATRRPTIWESKGKKSYTLPAQGRSATYVPSLAENKYSYKQKPMLATPLSPKEEIKPRANTLSAKFQALPAVPLNARLSDDVTQYYGELPVHTEMLAEMRDRISNSDTSAYSSVADVPTDILIVPIESAVLIVPGETQAAKRRSGLYKCRSVEDFSTSSSCEVSGLLETQGTSLSSHHTLYDTAEWASKDELYGQIINGRDNCDKPQTANSSSSSSSRPRMELPEITDYCTTVQPIPNSMRRALLPQDPDKAHKKTSDTSLGVGVYSTLQPEGENGMPAPVPKPRAVVASQREDIYDEVPVEKFYDEINSETRAELQKIQDNKTTELQPNKQPTNDYEMLVSESAVSTYDQLTSDSNYDEVLSANRDTLNGTNKQANKNVDLLCGSLTPDSPVSRRCNTMDVPLSPLSTRRKQDPLPPVPMSPKPTLLATPNSPVVLVKEPTFLIEEASSSSIYSTGGYMVAKPKKVSAIPYLGPDPLIDYKQSSDCMLVDTEYAHHYDIQYIPPYSKVNKKAKTDSVSKSVGTDLLQQRAETEPRESNSSSSSELDLTEEEKKLDRLKREFNREDKKRERIEGDLKTKHKYEQIRKDQQLIQQRLEGIRAKNIDMMAEVTKVETVVTKPVVNNNNDNEILRLQIEREKLEIERERQQLEREKIQMDRERSEMERMRLEHQKLILEKERLMFEKEKSELALMKLSNSSMGQSSD